MAEEKTFPMTVEGKAKIEEELNTLITETRAGNHWSYPNCT